MESDQYQMTDSEEEYGEEDKMLLDYARKSMRKKEESSDEEVFGFDKSDSDEDEEDLDEDDDDDDDNESKDEKSDIDMGSDIEEEEKLPDDRAWGKKKKSFYSTDFVDQDYEGIYQGAEAEIAELEEQEAKNIQKRLAEQLNDADFSITEEVGLAEAAESAAAKEQVIETDLSKLTKRQKLDLLKKESPEFFVLIQDFKEKMAEANKYLPLINYFKSKVKEMFPALEYLQTKFNIILKYRQLLEQMAKVGDEIVEPQLDSLLEYVKSGKEIPLDENFISMRKTLNVLSKKQNSLKKANNKVKEVPDEVDMDLVEEDLNDESDDEEVKNNIESETLLNDPNEKRAITYEMAKNKGLTPKRKKELRNPRVKNRRKYEKAKIRRKGQVRIPRKEIPVYGGEATGIKIGLTKSIKIK